ncbi:defective in cullin neddylation 1 [Lecanosticta acicola]|uniref:Defective in cullin neddylation protein n=1 Tax=Lecanosticta acicola TaxID=111012 RepID=A0AAI9EBP2_9PEZI|nr:defective in cullin neddylation 1 [Lecanosticta acicola]
MGKRKSDVVDPDVEEVSKKIKTTSVSRPSSAAYTPQQKNCINEFVGVTQTDKTTAARLLKQHNWATGAAINTFFANQSGAPNPNRAPLNRIFDNYRENANEEPDQIGMEGTAKLAEDLNVNLEDIGALVLFEIVQSPSLGLLTREGFVDGWIEFGVDSLAKMRNAVLQRRSQLAADRELFKSVYNHTFSLALAERQKALAPDTAFDFWQVLFGPTGLEWRTAQTNWLEKWKEFYTTKINKAVNKDLWKQTLTFALETLKDDSLSFWTEESSWPSVIDEFVEWMKEDRAANGEDRMQIP